MRPLKNFLLSTPIYGFSGSKDQDFVLLSHVIGIQDFDPLFAGSSPGLVFRDSGLRCGGLVTALSLLVCFFLASNLFIYLFYYSNYCT